MTVQPGLCQTWSEPQIVGFVMQRLIFYLPQQVFAVGVGHGVDKTELNAIATDPDSTHVLTVQNFQQLSKITASLNSQACKGERFFSCFAYLLQTEISNKRKFIFYFYFLF